MAFHGKNLAIIELLRRGIDEVGHEAFRDPEVMRVLLPILDAR